MYDSSVGWIVADPSNLHSIWASLLANIMSFSETLTMLQPYANQLLKSYLNASNCLVSLPIALATCHLDCCNSLLIWIAKQFVVQATNGSKFFRQSRNKKPEHEHIKLKLC